MNKKVFILFGLSVAALLASCKKGDDRPVRSDYIKVYETSVNKTLDNILVPFEGATDGQVHVLSNVPLQWKYLADQDDAEWFTIKVCSGVPPLTRIRPRTSSQRALAASRTSSNGRSSTSARLRSACSSDMKEDAM